MAAMTAVVMVFAGFSWLAPIMAAASAVSGWVIAKAYRSGDSPYPAFISTAFLVILQELCLLAYVQWSGVDINTELTRLISSSLASAGHMTGASGSSFNQLATDYVDHARLILPASLCVIALLIAGCVMALARLAVGKNVTQVSPLLLKWRLPYWVVGVYLVSLALVLVGWLRPVTLWWQIENSTVLVSGFLLGVQGISFIWRRMLKNSWRYVWLTLLILISPISIVGNIYILIGLIDLMNQARRSH